MRAFRIVVFTLGTVAGFGWALHEAHHHRDQHAAFERHVADVCVEAARRTATERPLAPTPQP